MADVFDTPPTEEELSQAAPAEPEEAPDVPSQSPGEHPLPTSTDVMEPGGSAAPVPPPEGDVWATPPTEQEMAQAQVPNPAELQLQAEHGGTQAGKAADIIRYSAASGLPPQLVAADLENVKKRVDAAGVDWKKLAERQPALAQFLVDSPHAIPLAMKDVHNLGMLEWAFGGHPWAAFMDAWHEQGTVGLQTLRAEGLKGLDPVIEKRLAEEKASSESFGPDYGTHSFLGRAIVGTAKMVPYMALDKAFRVLGAVPGAVAGYASGSATGPGALLTAGAGAGLGSFLSSGVFNYGEALGPLSWQLDHLKDENGRPINPAVADVASQTGAMLSGALMAGTLGLFRGPASAAIGKGLQKALPGVAEALTKVGSNAVVKWLTDGAVRSTVSKFIGRWGLHTTLGAAMMASNSALLAGTTEAAKGASGLDAQLGNVTDAAARGWHQGLEDMWLMAAFPPARQAMQELGQARASAQDAARFSAVIQAAKDSTVLDKSPEAFKQVVDLAAPNARVYVPAQDWVSYFQEKKLDPAQMATAAGLQPEQLTTALSSGGNLEFKASDFLAGLAKDGHAEGLSMDMKSSPEFYTPREFKARQESEAKRMVEDAKKRATELDDGKQRIEDFILAQARASRLKPGDVRSGAKLLAESAATQALRLNVSMQEAARLMNFGELSLSGAKGLTPEHAQALQDFQEWLAPSASHQLKARLETLSPEARARELYLDANTGLPNALHFDEANQNEAADSFAPGEDRPFAHVGVEGTKYVNDNLDHAQGDLLYRAAAKALHEAAGPDANVSKTGGDFELRVKDQAHLEDILQRANAAMPPELQGFTLTGAAGESRKAAESAHVELKKAAEAVGSRAERGKAPLGFKGDIKATPFPTAKAKGEVHPELAAHVGAMSNEEYFNKAYVEPKTGLLTNLGWQSLAHDPSYHYAALDLRGLKDANRLYGKDGGDKLIDVFGRVIAHYGGSSFDAAHLHGDEYALRHRDPAKLSKFLDTVRAHLDDVAEATYPDGEVVDVGVDFWHGIARGSYEAADRNLNERKVAAKASTEGDAARAPAGGEDHGGEGGRPGRLDIRREAFRRGAQEQGFPGAREARLNQEAVAPKPVLDAQAFIGRMRDQEKKAAAQAFLDYATGKTDKRPAEVPPKLEQELADKFGIVDPQGYSFGEDGRSLERGLGGKKVHGQEPDELRRYRLMNVEHRTGEEQSYKQPPIAYVEGKPVTFEQPAWHGSPHDFEQFSTHKIGTGEGHQSYGWGLYFAGKKEVAEHYREVLSDSPPTLKGREYNDLSEGEKNAMDWVWSSSDSKTPTAEALADARRKLARTIQAAEQDATKAGGTGPVAERLTVFRTALETLERIKPEDIQDRTGGKLYQVEVPEDHELLDYDKPLSEQPASVRKALETLVERAIGYPPREVESWPRGAPEPTGTLEDAKGRDVYDRLVEKLGSPEAVSRALDAEGVPGLRYLDQGSRGAGEGSHNYVIWRDDRVKVLNKFYQDPPGPDGGPRGEIRLDVTGSGRPRAFDIRMLNADKSTFVHEVAHFLSWSLHDLATSDLSTPQLQADYEALLKFAGYDSPEARLEALKEGSATAKEERISHGFEQFLSEGKAPSNALARVFSRLKGWLLGIYKGADGIAAQYRDRYGEELQLSDDVRGVFSRLLAQEEALKQATDTVGGTGELKEALAGMTPEEAKAYREALADSRVKAEQETAEGGDERQKALDAQREAFKKQTEAELDAKPVYRAWRYLQHGDLPELEGGSITPEHFKEFWTDEKGKPLKISRSDFEEMFPFTDAKLMPPASLKAKGGRPVEEMATRLGYQSATELVDAFKNAVPRDEAVTQGTQDKMDAAYGPELERATEAALSGVHNARDLRAAVMELRALAKQVNPELERQVQAVDVDALRRNIDRMTGEKMAEQLDPATHARTERKLALEAAELWGKGEKEAAVEKREQRLVNKLLFMSERDAKKELAAARNRLASVSEGVRASLGKADPAYRDVHDAITAAVRLGEPPPATAKTLDEMLAVATANAQDIDFDVEAIRRLLAQPKAWDTSLSVDEARNVSDAISNIRTVARRSLQVKLAGKLVDREEYVQRLVKSVLESRPATAKEGVQRSNDSLKVKAGRVLQAFDGNLSDIATLAHMLDGGNRDGPVHELFVDERHAARDVVTKLTNEVLGPVMKKWEAMPKEVKELMSQPVDLSDLPLPESLGRFEDNRTREALWMMFLNWGNEGNKQRLLDGYGWQSRAVESALSKLRPEEADFLQTVLDVTDELYGPMADVHEADTGIRPEKVSASPITLNGKTYGGGYFPAKYDFRASRVGARQLATDIKNVSQVFGEANQRPAIGKSHAKARADEVHDAPIDLSAGVVSAHLSNVINDIANRSYVKDAASILLDSRVRDALEQRIGSERAKQFMPLLQTVANAQADSVSANLSTLERVNSWFRNRMAIQAVGWSLRSSAGVVADPLNAVAAGLVSPVRLAPALVKTWNPATYRAVREAAAALSPELQAREVMRDTNLRNAFGEMLGKPKGTVAKLRDTAFWFHTVADSRNEVAVWTARYNQSVAEGREQELAIRDADDAVRAVTPSHDPAEKAAILRSKSGISALLTFYGYANKVWNLSRRNFDSAYLTLVGDKPTGEKAKDLAKYAGTALALLASHGVVSEYLTGRGKEEDETTAHWLLRKAITAPFNLVPFLGSVVEAVVEGKKVSVKSAPAAAFLEDTATRLAKLTKDTDETTEDKLLNLVETLAGFATGAPTAAVHRPLDYLKKANRGEARVRGPLDAAAGVVYGESKAHPANPLTDAQDVISGQ